MRRDDYDWLDDADWALLNSSSTKGQFARRCARCNATGDTMCVRHVAEMRHWLDEGFSLSRYIDFRPDNRGHQDPSIWESPLLPADIDHGLFWSMMNADTFGDEFERPELFTVEADELHEWDRTLGYPARRRDIDLLRRIWLHAGDYRAHVEEWGPSIALIKLVSEPRADLAEIRRLRSDVEVYLGPTANRTAVHSELLNVLMLRRVVEDIHGISDTRWQIPYAELDRWVGEFEGIRVPPAPGDRLRSAYHDLPVLLEEIATWIIGGATPQQLMDFRQRRHQLVHLDHLHTAWRPMPSVYLHAVRRQVHLDLLDSAAGMMYPTQISYRGWSEDLLAAKLIQLVDSIGDLTDTGMPPELVLSWLAQHRDL